MLDEMDLTACDFYSQMHEYSVDWARHSVGEMGAGTGMPSTHRAVPTQEPNPISPPLMVSSSSIGHGCYWATLTVARPVDRLVESALRD